MSLTLVVYSAGLSLTVTATPAVVTPVPPAYPVSPLRRPIFQLLVTSSDGQSISRIDINPDVALTWKSGIGGWAECTVGIVDMDRLVYAYLPTMLDARGFAEVRVMTGGQTCFWGRLSAPQRPGGHLRAFTAKGHGLALLNDDWFRGGVGSATAGVILRSALSSASLLRPAGADVFIDTGVTHTFAEFARRAPAQIVEQLAQEGGLYQGDNVPWWYFVWEDGLHFKPRLCPASGPDYRIPFDSSVVPWEEDYEQVYSDASIVVTLNGVERVITQSNPDVTARYGIRRSPPPITAPSGVSAEGASQYLRTWLDAHANPVVSATLTRSYERGLETASGAEREPWRVRAGEWVEVGDEDPLPIMSTSFAAQTGALSITLGPPSPRRWAGMLTGLLRLQSAVTTNTNPITQGRAA